MQSLCVCLEAFQKHKLQKAMMCTENKLNISMVSSPKKYVRKLGVQIDVTVKFNVVN